MIGLKWYSGQIVLPCSLFFWLFVCYLQIKNRKGRVSPCPIVTIAKFGFEKRTRNPKTFNDPKVLTLKKSSSRRILASSCMMSTLATCLFWQSSVTFDKQILVAQSLWLQSWRLVWSSPNLAILIRKNAEGPSTLRSSTCYLIHLMICSIEFEIFIVSGLDKRDSVF